MKHITFLLLFVTLISCGTTKSYYFMGKDMTKREYKKVVKVAVRDFVNTLTDREKMIIAGICIQVVEK